MAASRGATCARARGRRSGPPPRKQISLYNTQVEFRDSAFKHGLSPTDIDHAVRNALAVYEDPDDPFVLYLGPSTSGAILEVMVAIDEDGAEIAFHAMEMRDRYRRLLP